ncbi:MAG: CRISPR-associated endonuclease Cas2 [Pirellulaceae bacterium]
MYVLVTYDVNTETREGRRRIAKTCLDYGQRGQQSVFELKGVLAQWTECKAKLIEIMEPSLNSVRFYYLGTNWKRRV